MRYPVEPRNLILRGMWSSLMLDLPPTPLCIEETPARNPVFSTLITLILFYLKKKSFTVEASSRVPGRGSENTLIVTPPLGASDMHVSQCSLIATSETHFPLTPGVVVFSVLRVHQKPGSSRKGCDL